MDVLSVINTNTAAVKYGAQSPCIGTRSSVRSIRYKFLSTTQVPFLRQQLELVFRIGIFLKYLSRYIYNISFIKLDQHNVNINLNTYFEGLS